MRGVYCDGSSIRLRRDLDPPTPKGDEVVLTVRAVGICDTDLQIARGYMGFRGVLGHEFVGVDSTGNRFTAEINNACHVCDTCLQGNSGHCPNRSVLGILGHDGAMADFIAVPRRNLHAVPDAIDDRDAVFIEPLAAAFRITEQAHFGPEIKIAVLGDGKLGMLCAWVARQTGADVSLIGKHRAKLAIAGPGVRTILLDQAESHARSFNVVADCTGSSTGFPTALQLVKPRGTVVLKTTVAGDYTINLAPIVIDEVSVIGSRCGPFSRAIAALANREIDVKPLIGEVFSLDNAETAFAQAAARGARKVIMTVD